MSLDYDTLAKVLASLTDGETDTVSLMATVACEVHRADPRFDWTGFYRVVGPHLLKIGPYQGGHGCLVIPFDKGVCGAAARTGQVQLVDDVDAKNDGADSKSMLKNGRSGGPAPVSSFEEMVRKMTNNPEYKVRSHSEELRLFYA